MLSLIVHDCFSALCGVKGQRNEGSTANLVNTQHWSSLKSRELGPLDIKAGVPVLFKTPSSPSTLCPSSGVPNAVIIMDLETALADADPATLDTISFTNLSWFGLLLVFVLLLILSGIQEWHFASCQVSVSGDATQNSGRG
jgi:hypothetical protein